MPSRRTKGEKYHQGMEKKVGPERREVKFIGNKGKRKKPRAWEGKFWWLGKKKTA